MLNVNQYRAYIFFYIIYLLAYANILLFYHICKQLTYFGLLYDNRLMNIKYFTILNKIATFAAVRKDIQHYSTIKTLVVYRWTTSRDMAKYYAVTYKNGLYTIAYSNNKQKCEEFVKSKKTVTNNKGKVYKLKVKEISETAYTLCGVDGILFLK